MSECKCDLRTRLVGDGCRYCNPQWVIDRLIEDRDELAKECERLEEAIDGRGAAVQFNHADGTATRFDLTPAMTEPRIRDALIALGWTPPEAKREAVAVQTDSLVCVGRARFPKRGGNAGLSWYVEDAMGDTGGFRTGSPADKELLFVIPATTKRAMLAASQQAEEHAETVSLRYHVLRAADAGEQRHAQTVMRELGITYREAIPQSLGDQWWFLGCENVPASLPAFLSVMETKP